MGGPAVVARQLHRVYHRKRQPPRTALARLDLVLEPGEIHGLLGPNGAGKTTLCKILSTVLIPTSGSAEIFGHDIVAQARLIRPMIGIVFGGERGLYARLTARQNLVYWSALYRQPRAEARRRVTQLLERTGLADRADERVETFSRGMKQRLHLARGLIGNPRMLMLDEPTAGMDPAAARDFRSLVGELRAEGRTVLITTHDMTEAEAVCDRVSLIDRGRLVATESPRTIGEWLTTYDRVVAEDVPAATVAAVKSLPAVVSIVGDSGSIVVEVDSASGVGDVLRTLVAAGVTTVSTTRPSLEDIYLRLIGDRGLAIQ